jgi:predicted DNA-binding antitoxin AbrB/MazE fold protein
MELIQAIYEHGVLRPLQPVSLDEQEVVSLAISRPNGTLVTGDQQRAFKQRDAVLRFIDKMESLPDNTPNDGLSNRDHDRLIYGS